MVATICPLGEGVVGSLGPYEGQVADKPREMRGEGEQGCNEISNCTLQDVTMSVCKVVVGRVSKTE